MQPPVPTVASHLGERLAPLNEPLSCLWSMSAWWHWWTTHRSVLVRCQPLPASRSFNAVLRHGGTRRMQDIAGVAAADVCGARVIGVKSYISADMWRMIIMK